MAERITGHTELIGLMAYPIRHSSSPAMQNEAFAKLGYDYAYLAFEVGADEIEDAVINAIQGIKDDESAKDRLYVLSQDKKLLAPLFSAEVHSANSKNPKSKDFPFVITVRSGVTSNNVFGWYKDEESAKAELQNIYKAIKFAEKNQYAVYEMN